MFDLTKSVMLNIDKLVGTLKDEDELLQVLKKKLKKS